jgi:hypothetical protein
MVNALKLNTAPKQEMKFISNVTLDLESLVTFCSVDTSGADLLKEQ